MSDTELIDELNDAEREIDNLRAALAERGRMLGEAAGKLRNLEVAANSVRYCYDKHPKNFAAALESLRFDAESARDFLSAYDARQSHD